MISIEMLIGRLVRYCLVGIIGAMLFLTFTPSAKAELNCQYDEELNADRCNLDGEYVLFSREYNTTEAGKLWLEASKIYKKHVKAEVKRQQELNVEAKKIEVLGRLERLSSPTIFVNSHSSSKSNTVNKNTSNSKSNLKSTNRITNTVKTTNTLKNTVRQVNK